MEQKPRKIGIHFNAEEHAKIAKRAAEHGLTFGRFVKNAALENKVESTIKHIKTIEPKLIRELNYVGNNFNQVAKRLNEMRLANMTMDRVLLGSIHDVLKDVRASLDSVKAESLK